MVFIFKFSFFFFKQKTAYEMRISDWSSDVCSSDLRSTEIIVDPKCRSLKGFVGADWVAREFHMTPDEVKEVYDYDVKAKGYTTYGTEEPENVRRARTVVGDEKSGEGKVCVWRVFHKRSGHEFTIADGCKDYLRPPAAPVPPLEQIRKAA